MATLLGGKKKQPTYGSYRMGQSGKPDTLALNNGKDQYLVGGTGGKGSLDSRYGKARATVGEITGRESMLSQVVAGGPAHTPKDFPNRNVFQQKDGGESAKRAVAKNMGPLTELPKRRKYTPPAR